LPSARAHAQPCETELGGAIKDLTHGGADFTLDTSSQPEGRIAAVRAPRYGARCALSASATT
jgi:hypothetical protein